VFIGLGVVVV